jgi:hypothetical protein
MNEKNNLYESCMQETAQRCNEEEKKHSTAASYDEDIKQVHLIIE